MGYFVIVSLCMPACVLHLESMLQEVAHHREKHGTVEAQGSAGRMDAEPNSPVTQMSKTTPAELPSKKHSNHGSVHKGYERSCAQSNIVPSSCVCHVSSRSRKANRIVLHCVRITSCFLEQATLRTVNAALAELPEQLKRAMCWVVQARWLRRLPKYFARQPLSVALGTCSSQRKVRKGTDQFKVTAAIYRRFEGHSV
eukprot:4948216-Amphidinium_carterae.2